MNERAWSTARKARTLVEAHEALIALRPLRQAAGTAWVDYYRRSSSVYRHVAEVDPGHQGHALYWAEREKLKADDLAARLATQSTASAVPQRPKPRANSKVEAADLPTRLEGAHEVLQEMRPEANAAPEAWLAYHRYAAAIFAEIAEVDRAHHHESMAWLGLERQKAAELANQLGKPSQGPPV